MAHLNAAYLKQLRDNAATGISFSNEPDTSSCSTCSLGKLFKAPFKPNTKRAEKKLELAHSDLCYVPEPSMGGAKYFLTFLDDHSRRIIVYFLKTKDEVHKYILHYINLVENQCQEKLKTLRSDNGKEYVNEKVKQLLESKGIRHETSIPYNPQQNVRAERINRTLLDKARCMLIEAGLPKKFWVEAVATAAYLCNWSPKKCLNNLTPEHIWTGTKPDLANVRIFGCKVFVHVPNHLRGKLDAKAMEGIFTGYCPDQKGYRVYDPHTGKIIASRDVIFHEEIIKQERSKQIYLPIEPPVTDELQPDAGDNAEPDNIEEDDPEPPTSERDILPSASSDDLEEEIAQPIRRSQRTKNKPRYLDEYVVYSATSGIGEPQNFSEAVNGSEMNQWWSAMQSEYGSIVRNKTWELCEPPRDRKIVVCKWIYKKKKK